jgi:predicted N-acetyltransferase YhbS
LGRPPAIDALLGALPEQPTAYFIHDLTVDASLRRRNLASMLVPLLAEIARGLAINRMILVAVGGSAPFWTRTGFRTMEDEHVQAAARAKYGAGAVQMERRLV